MSNRITSQLGTFHPEAGLSVKHYPSLLRTAQEAKIHINMLRLLEWLPCEPMDEERMRVLPPDEWQSTVQESPDGYVRTSIGLYQPSEHACFIKNDAHATREQLGKLLTHELTHFGSHGGLHNYSRPLNEGMTENIARIVFKHSVGKKVFGTAEDPNPFYTHEYTLWKVLQWSRPEFANELKRIFWSNAPEQARTATRHHLGEVLCNSLESCPCTPDAVQEIIRMLVESCPKERRTSLEQHAPEAIILAYAWENLATNLRITVLPNVNEREKNLTA